MSEPNKETKPTKAIRVLIADDDPPTRILLRSAISQWGYQTVEAKDGEEAWDLLQLPDAPRLLILDWLMPRLDGVELCKRIKENNTHPPYIVLLTQMAGTSNNIIKGLEAGADEFLPKPFNMAELRSRLSVGARIIGYESSLSEKNIQLEECEILKTLGMLVKETAGAYSIKTNITDNKLQIVFEVSGERNSDAESKIEKSQSVFESNGGTFKVENINDNEKRFVLELPL